MTFISSLFHSGLFRKHIFVVSQVHRKPGSIAQNVNFYAKHVNIANWQKFTVSAQNQTAEDLLKDLHKNKLWFYTQWLLFVTKSSNWGPKINKTEIRNFKVKKLMQSFYRCQNLVWC